MSPGAACSALTELIRTSWVATPFNRRSDQVATLTQETVDAIQAQLHRREHPRFVFEFGGCTQTLRRRFKKVLKRARIDTRNRKVFHDLRRTSYTLVTAAFDKPTASRQCGHSQDLSRFYLDEKMLASLNPNRRIAESIARPLHREVL